ncbi:NAD(P)-dependent oxidoreductase [Edaphobacter paludis]|uniref:NAD(P)-dependent oxidoreductase n=1 Tax=Edaphobacter paludis TaxID=3035702 RepID=A0AAU7CX74_9BACT
MHIVLFGATGHSGSRILTELLSRGHQVTAITRDPAKLSPQPNLTIKQGDADSVAAIAANIKGADAVVSAYAPPADNTDQILPVTQYFIEAIKQVGTSGKAPRFLYVGGAASLEVAPGVTLLDSGHLPAAWQAIAKSHSDALALIKKSDINWTSFSPAAFFEPGQRTGKFRLGKDQLITDAQGNSKISMEDYAIALVDELEKPQHERQRFTIGY